MNKFKNLFCGVAAMLIPACTSTHVGLKENWIDERDVIALANASVSEWIVKAGRPTLVEINGDTSIYYYNYKPTMYAVAVYDSTTLFKTWGSAKEAKPDLENATEIWGSRKNTMQIKVVDDAAVFAVIIDGPDKKSFIRDLNGDIILDPSSGYNSNISNEQKINSSSKQFRNAYSSLQGKIPNIMPIANKPNEPVTMSPWEAYRYRQQEIHKENPEETSESIPEAAPEPTVAPQN